DAQRRRVAGGVGGRVQWGAGMRLLLRVSALSARMQRGRTVLPGPLDSGRQVPDDVAGRTRPRLWGACARGLAGVVWRDSSACGVGTADLSVAAAGGAGRGAAAGDQRRTTDDAQPEHGQTIRATRAGVL